VLKQYLKGRIVLHAAGPLKRVVIKNKNIKIKNKIEGGIMQMKILTTEYYVITADERARR